MDADNNRQRSGTATSFGLPFELEPDTAELPSQGGSAARDQWVDGRSDDERRFSFNGVERRRDSSGSANASSQKRSQSISTSNNLPTTPYPISTLSSSPAPSSIDFFSFSPPLQHGSTGLGRVAAGGRERSISVVTAATSWGGSPRLDDSWNGNDNGKEDVDEIQADEGGESHLERGKGKEVIRHSPGVIKQDSEISECSQGLVMNESERTSTLSIVEEHDNIEGTSTVEIVSPDYPDGVCSTPGPSSHTTLATETVLPTCSAVNMTEAQNHQPPEEGRASGSLRPPIVAPAPRQTRSRAHSLARSLVGSVNTQGSDSTYPSPASSIRSGKLGMFKGRMKANRNSFLAALAGGNEGMSSQPGSRTGSRPPSPIPDGMRTPDSGTGKGKGKVKGFVKKYMTRTRSTLSVPMMATDSPGQGTPIGGRSQLDLASIEEHTAKSPRVRSKSLEGTGSLPYLPPIQILPSPESPASSGLTSAQTKVDGPNVAEGSSSTMSSQEVRQRCWFDTLLPRELKIRIFETLIALHVREHEWDVEIGRFRGTKARTTRWLGCAAGRREIVKLSRVSKGWRSLAFDGPLWARADLNQFSEHMAPSTTANILTSVASFLQTLDLRGWDVLPDVAVRRALSSSGWNMRLEVVDLRYCQQLSKDTLAGIIESAPRLRHLNLRGLDAVDWPLIMLTNKHCPRLAHLDVSFCRSAGIIENQDLSVNGEWSSLRSLRIAGGLIGTGVLGGLARSMPNLEVLDLSHSPAIDDDEVLDFVRVPQERDEESSNLLSDSIASLPKIIRLRPIQGGLPATAAGDNGLISRRVTNLRQLNLSRCPLLSDQACHYLAHAVPDLEILELALIGAGLKDDGLVALFGTTPKIRRVDLEMATDLTDRTIQALTPPKPGTLITDIAGCDLESLSIGYAGQITTDAIMHLLRHAPKLSHLGLDNTVVSDVVVKEFIRKRTPGASSSSLNVVDCRHVSRNVVEAFERQTRPRRGWRGWQAVPFNYQDGSRPRSGRDECVEVPVLQSFWTWSKVPRTPASLLMSGEPKHGLRELTDGEITPRRQNDERSCTLM